MSEGNGKNQSNKSQKAKTADRYSASLLKNHAPSLKKDEVLEGQLIWAQMEGHPPWPGKIHELSATSKEKLFVYFFGPDETEKWGWIRLDQAKLFSDASAKWFLSKVEPHLKTSTEAQSLKSAIVEALEYYNQLIAFIESGLDVALLPLITTDATINQVSVKTLSKRLRNQAIEMQKKQQQQALANSEADALLNQALVSPLDEHNEDLCFVCNLGGFLILCDGCPNACHCDCDDPPMKAVPEGVWFCSQCREKQKRGESVIALSDADLLLAVQTLVENEPRPVEPVESSSESSSEESESSEESDDGEWRKKPIVNRSIHFNDHSARCADPIKTILNRGYWGGLRIKTGSQAQFQLLQNELLLHPRGARNKRNSRLRARASDIPESPVERKVQTEKKQPVAPKAQKDVKIPAKAPPRKPAPMTTRKRKRQITSAAKRRFVRSKIVYSESESDHSIDSEAHMSDSGEDDEVKAASSQVKFMPKPSEVPNIEPGYTHRHIVPSLVQKQADTYSFKEIEPDPNTIDSYIYSPGTVHLQEVPTRKQFPLYIRYRFTDEKDHSFRLIKTKVSILLSRMGIRGQDIARIIAEDASISADEYYEMRYYDKEFSGWALMEKDYLFPVNLAEGDITLQILVYYFQSEMSDKE